VSTFDYRRELTLKELLPAVGAALGAGIAVFYLARTMLQRTPLPPRPPIVDDRATADPHGKERPPVRGSGA
jgi:hypothetical protein